MSMLDPILAGIRTVLSNGTAMPARSTINFVGATVEDDAANERTNINVGGGSGGGSFTGTTYAPTGVALIEVPAWSVTNLRTIGDTDAQIFLPPNETYTEAPPEGAQAIVRIVHLQYMPTTGIGIWGGGNLLAQVTELEIGALTFQYTAATGWFLIASAAGAGIYAEGGGA